MAVAGDAKDRRAGSDVALKFWRAPSEITPEITGATPGLQQRAIKTRRATKSTRTGRRHPGGSALQRGRNQSFYMVDSRPHR